MFRNCIPLLYVVLAACVSAGEAPKEEVELRIYDVSELTSSNPDYPGPDGSLISNTVEGAPVQGQPAPRAVPTCASISDMIRQRVSPDQWDAALGTSIEEMGGRLVIMQRPAIHSVVNHLLKVFTGAARAQVVVKALMIPSADIPDQTFFESDGLNKLFGGDASTHAIAAPRLVCFNKQRAHVVSGTEVNCVRDLDVNGDTHDPVIATLIEGIVFDVTPILSDDRSTVDIDLRVTMNANVKRNPKVLGVSPAANLRAVAPLQEVENGAAKDAAARTVNQMMNAQYVAGIEMDTPSMDNGAIRTDVVIPSGKWILAGTMNNLDAKSAKKNLLVFVSAEEVK